MSSPLADRHRAAGARFAGDGPDAELLTFGDVPAEYAAGAEGCLLLDATRRGLVRVAGGERSEFLHRLTANMVRGLEPGHGNRNLLLTAKGKIVQDFDLRVDAEEIWLSTAPGQGEALVTALDMYLFAEDVTLEDRSEQHAPLELTGPGAAEVVAAACGAAPPTELHHSAVLSCGEHDVQVTRLPVAGSAGYRLDAGPAGVATLWDALVAAGASPGGRVALDCLRVEAGSPEFGIDIDENIYPQEARAEHAFHLEKGCYIGQEVVAKIDTYGGLNKRLVVVALDHDDPLPRGAELLVPDPEKGLRSVGVATSWAYSFVRDTGVALAYVKRRHQGAGTRFTVRAPGDGPELGHAEVVPMPLREGALSPTGEFEAPVA
jgi:folate-binding protein YgfZ